MSSLKLVSLSSVAEITQGGRLKLSGNDFVETGFPAYGAGGLNGYLEVAEFDRPAIVLSSIGARCGKCFYVDGRWTSLANTQLIFPDLSRVDPKYLWYQLNDESSWIRSGTAQPFIKPSNVKARLVALPAIAEQRRIAAILDKADTLRTKRREAIAKLDQLLKSVFINMFGESVANSKNWPISRLGDLLEIKWGNTSITKESYLATGVPAYSASGRDGYLPHAEHDGEGIVLSAIGARCGKCFYVDSGPWTAIKNTITLRPIAQSRVDLRYVMRLINDERFWPSRGGGQPFIALGAARDQMIQVPPVELQHEFSKWAVKIERLRADYQRGMDTANRCFESLQQRAFAGDL